jgi:hypothetical protein
MDKIDASILKKCDEQIKYDDIFEKKRRVIAIGDIHGDLEALMVLLDEVADVVRFKCNIRNNKNIKSIDDIPFKWIGQDTYVVLVGDTIDRKRVGSIKEDDKYLIGEIENEEIIIINLLNKITLKANEAGGRLIKLLGNHEVMNLYGYFNYVSDATLKPDRKKKFKSGGELAHGIIKCGTLGIVKIGDWIFVHGGILPGLVKHIKNKNVDNFISKANVLAKQMFSNIDTMNDHDKELMKAYFLENDMNTIDNGINGEIDKLYNKRDAILNERRLSSDRYGGIKVPVTTLCDALKQTFELMGYSKNSSIVVAHSVQLERGFLKQINNDIGYIGGYVQKNIKYMDNKKIIYSGKGIKIDKPITRTNIFPHGINYECPIPNKNYGNLYRIDTGVSRGFDINMNENNEIMTRLLQARRPSAIEILYDSNINDYIVNTLVAFNGLTRNNININDSGPLYIKN